MPAGLDGLRQGTGVRRVEQGASHHGDGRPGFRSQLCGFRVDSPVHLNFHVQTPPVDLGADRLGLGGIGGKTSAGFGKFEVKKATFLNKSGDAQAQWLYRALTTPAPRSMLLTSSLPRDDELDAAMQDACYQLVRRAGIVASNALPEGTRKKQTQYFFSAGSVLASRFTGDVYQVGPRNTHPVYRYAKPIFLGVAL
mgnify:CR=1 FL=1